MARPLAQFFTFMHIFGRKMELWEAKKIEALKCNQFHLAPLQAANQHRQATSFEIPSNESKESTNTK